MTHSPNNSETLKDFNRLSLNYRKSLVQEVLPEYFQTDYPDLITFLEGYYEYLDSDEQWGGIINGSDAFEHPFSVNVLGIYAQWNNKQ